MLADRKGGIALSTTNMQSLPIVSLSPWLYGPEPAPKESWSCGRVAGRGHRCLGVLFVAGQGAREAGSQATGLFFSPLLLSFVADRECGCEHGVLKRQAELSVKMS